jgi:hypothetical protein
VTRKLVAICDDPSRQAKRLSAPRDDPPCQAKKLTAARDALLPAEPLLPGVRTLARMHYSEKKQPIRRGRIEAIS